MKKVELRESVPAFVWKESMSMEATKALLRHSLRSKLDAALDSESALLVQHWCSSECQASFRSFLEQEDVFLQRPRLLEA
uniref:Uncharacterized protein n=1 Tax=Timema monikensis TaxID=170555 RepID=A0A7R9DXD5_9NEOP|nr:unnamed protein product [Timema monikensis]